MPNRASSSGSFHLFQLFGIDVFLHWTWFVVAVIQIQIAGDAYQNIFWHILTYVGLFGIVLVHEFGHALACRSVGGIANRIVLWPLGGIAFVQPPQRPGPVLWSIAAGPLVNVALLPVTAVVFGLVVGLPPQGVPVGYWMSGWSDVQAFVASLTLINAMLLFFNLLPIYPLDGGQIFQALLWFVVGRVTSLRIAAGLGLVVSILGGLAAFIFWGDWWLALIAAFLAFESYRGLQLANLIAAQEAMRPGAPEPWRM